MRCYHYILIPWNEIQNVLLLCRQCQSEHHTYKHLYIAIYGTIEYVLLNE